MQGADGVADSALCMLAIAAYRLNRMADVADVVERIKDAKHIHAIQCGLVDKTVHHAVFVVAVAQQVLTPQQHLQARVGQQGAELAQALPRVFVEEADAGVKGGTAPALDGPVTGLVDVGAGRHHVFHGHAGGQQTLVGVAQA